MWHMNQLQIAEQHQAELREEAKRWRMTRQNDEYQPNKAIRRNKRRFLG